MFEGRVCIVSGVGPGLGREIALLVAEQGADVVLGARTERVLEEVAAEVEARGRRALAVPTDVTDNEQCERIVAAAADTFGRVDVLVNNAYVPDVFKTFEKVELDEWRRIVDVNLFGPLQMSKAVVPHMRARGGGSIVFVNSMIVRKPMVLQGGYAVSKGALLTAAQVLAQELGRHKIRVNSVLPGWMWGPQVEAYVSFSAQRRNVDEQAIVDEITSSIPLASVPTDGEVAQAVAFLASDRASAITGQALDVNGGEVFA